MKIDRLSTVDLVDLAVETPDNTMNIGALVRLEGGRLLDRGQLRLAEIRAELARHVAGLPRLRQIVTRPGLLAGRPLWTDDPTFRIERHVGQVELAPPGDETALLRLVADLLRPRMDLRRPFWRMWFVTGLPNGEIAVVVAMHHVLADGAAALELLRSLTRRTRVHARVRASASTALGRTGPRQRPREGRHVGTATAPPRQPGAGAVPAAHRGMAGPAFVVERAGRSGPQPCDWCGSTCPRFDGPHTRTVRP